MNTSLRDTPSEDLAAILLTPTGRDTTLIRGVLEPEGIPCRPVGTVAELLEAVGSDYSAGVLVIAEEALDPASARDLAGFLGGEPAWSDLPVLLLGRTSFSARRLLRQIRRRSTQVLGRPLSPATLRASVHSAVEIRRRQYEARALLFDAHSLNDQLRERATQLRRLSLELSDAEERERKRLAVYVHDDLQQILAGIKFHLDVTEQRLDDKKRAGKTIALVKELVMDAIEGSRTLAHELSPPVLRRNGLLAGLRWLTGRVNNLRGLAVHLETDVEREPANPATVIFLFRAAQELLLNVSKHAETDQAWLVLRDLEKSIVLTVRDNGKGFDPQELENPEQGKGFGLFSLQERVELLGGSASIESAPGEGTVVTLRVPLESYRWRESTPDSPISTPPASESSTGDLDGSTQLRLLLVDDHTLMRTGLRVMLAEQPGIEILGEYGDGLEAVKAASTLQPDVILMDVSMPRMDGIEATKVIKQEHPKIRIIALSMFDDPETKQKMIDAGAERFVTKSGPGEELVKAIFQAPRSR